ncbi:MULTISPECIES: helix-turn-helix domain-containing protein [unclassified Sphingomonas]|uniref:helix-turn-helix domain-containing protein n=1 Tax=unclassified Sphingomonas TaxID=196159 RepID=UPI000833FB28|nr:MULTISPECIES: helix-turn-helix domain-containing protein [unclassified Sphingomonas]
MLSQMHPEDVKAAIRKRFRTISNFESQKGLPEKSVHDTLRGRTSGRVAAAIEAVLAENAASSESEHSEHSAADAATHRLNEAAE